MQRSFAATILGIALVFVLSAVRHAPPPALPESADAAAFSAARARATQAFLVANGSRATGTAANEAARQVLVDRLRALGFEVEVASGFACGKHGTCAFVHDVVARRPGRRGDAKAVLLAAHYDSVLASSGASDDGLGVAAVVEAGRALAAAPPLERPIVLLLADGEEDGLLGARFFLEHRWAKTVGAVVNVDSRGSSGPSAMFETTDESAFVVGLLGGASNRPVTSSVFAEVYRRMPNDTDFTELRKLARGVNFANIGRVEHYHTKGDDLANSSPETLQHHGEQALAMTRAFAGADLEAMHPGRAIWFDVLAAFVVRLPEGAALPVAIAALALLGLGLARTRGSTPAQWAVAMGAFPAAAASGLAAAHATGVVLRAASAFPAVWIATPFWGLLAVFTVGVFAAASVMSLAHRFAPSRHVGLGVLGWWAVLGVVVAVVAPGAGHVFYVPALAAGIGALFPRGTPIVALAASIVAAILWVPFVSPLYDVVGLFAPVAVAAPLVLLTTTLVPPRVTTSRPVQLVTALVVLAASAMAIAVPKFTPAHAQRVNVTFAQDDDRARVLLDASWGPVSWGPEPRAMRDALGPSAVEPTFPWGFGRAAHAAAVPKLDLVTPLVEPIAAEADAVGEVRARLRSRRGATTLAFTWTNARDVTVEGRWTEPRGNLLAVMAVPPAGVVVRMTRNADKTPIELTVYDRSPGVPSNTVADAVVRARPAAATPSQDGDTTVTSTRARL